MCLPHLDKSLCGCCTLETGSKIIGYLSLVSRALAIITNLLNENAKTDAEHKADAKTWLIIAVIVVVFFALVSVFDILMLVGVYKRRPSFMFPWIVVQVIYICLILIAAIASLSVGKIVGSIISSGFTIYFLLVVNSHYQNLKSGTTPPY